MILWTAHLVTESADHYIWVYDYKPTRKEVIRRLYEWERAASLKWYTDYTSVTIEEQEVITKGEKA